jgi:hypothetical protein
MDQVKAYLAIVRKHHFWLLSAIVLIVGVLSWWKSSTALSAAYDSQKATIETKFRDATSVTQISEHPNQTFIDGVTKIHDRVKHDVYDAWQSMYEAQSRVLVWPKLSNEFDRFIAGKPRLSDIPQNLRETYKNFASEHLQRLYKIITVMEEEEVKNAAGEPEKRLTGIVSWPTEARAKLARQFEWAETPTPKAIWYAQEDFWVYQNLMEIIAKTNAGATDNSNATIKSIIEIAIGKDVTENNKYTLGPIENAQAVPAASGRTGGDSKSAAALDAALEANRYVSLQGAAIATEAESAREFRLMPVRMRVVLDQRRLFDFLANCINATLPISIRSLALQQPNALEGGASSRSSSSAAGNAKKATLPSDANEMELLLVGMVSLYNPPDAATIGIDPATLAAETGTDTPPDTSTTEATADGSATEVPAEPASEGEAATVTEPMSPDTVPATPDEAAPAEASPMPMSSQ